MTRYAMTGLATLAGVVAVTLYIYSATGIAHAVFAFGLFYAAWELTLFRIRIILGSPNPGHIADGRYEMHITTAYLDHDRTRQDNRK